VNWLAKLNQSKPFPVPFNTRDNIPISKARDPSTPWGAWNVNEVMRPEEAEFEETSHPNMSYLDQGNVGVVYDLGDSVIKYTSDVSEAQSAQEIYENPIPCAVRVLQPPTMINDKLAKIVLEKVTPLNSAQKKIIWDAVDTYENNRGETLEDMIERLSPTERQLVLDYDYLRNCLWENGFNSGETHEHNIGYNSEGTLVLLDLGGA
jgi:hypothetical protein